MASEALTWVSPRTWDGALGLAAPSRVRARINGHRLHRLARVLESDSVDDLYRHLVSQWHEEDGIALKGSGGWNGPRGESARSDEPVRNRMRRFDIEHYLPDDLLTKVDRASMSVSLESRGPFVDREVVVEKRGMCWFLWEKRRRRVLSTFGGFGI